MEVISVKALSFLTGAVGLAWLFFLVTVFWPALIRRLARILRRTPVAQIIRPEYYVADLLVWSRHTAEAMLNVTKSYDWRVSQWSALGTAILTATLTFVSTVVIDYFKDTIFTNVDLKLRVALLGILTSILVYLMSQKRISLLREQFLRVCTLLQRRGEE